VPIPRSERLPIEFKEAHIPTNFFPFIFAYPTFSPQQKVRRQSTDSVECLISRAKLSPLPWPLPFEGFCLSAPLHTLTYLSLSLCSFSNIFCFCVWKSHDYVVVLSFCRGPHFQLLEFEKVFLLLSLSRGAYINTKACKF